MGKREHRCSLPEINDFTPPLWVCGLREYCCLVFPELRTYIAFSFLCLCANLMAYISLYE
ncbi:hypothetical protein NC651_027584 [Populus alba x Populus x berolinensis]|nr:hypothetical protein NC651_027584 [Populus alba x Populus x berolinensis]